jgi:hypothetical protein
MILPPVFVIFTKNKISEAYEHDQYIRETAK